MGLARRFFTVETITGLDAEDIGAFRDALTACPIAWKWTIARLSMLVYLTATVSPGGDVEDMLSAIGLGRSQRP